MLRCFSSRSAVSGSDGGDHYGLGIQKLPVTFSTHRIGQWEENSNDQVLFCSQLNFSDSRCCEQNCKDPQGASAARRELTVRRKTLLAVSPAAPGLLPQQQSGLMSGRFQRRERRPGSRVSPRSAPASVRPHVLPSLERLTPSQLKRHPPPPETVEGTKHRPAAKPTPDCQNTAPRFSP